ncbi:type II CAAX prenyl endopeptidase Rce1 family protein [Elizabethkingia meningoseptica]|uniref:CPBP family glutamic-type intramembrane protease n=1 Tax=Elizabethkingia meningoseptica TaxID=238 RepID=UPI003892BA09
MKLKMVIRPVLFCLLCAASLALVSGLIKDIPTKWNQHLLLIITICIVVCLTLLFGKWEKYTSKDIGIKLSKTSIKMIITGFGIGLLMTLLQPVILTLFGHYKLSFRLTSSLSPIFFYFSLYTLVALREELAFRAYPLFSLNYSYGRFISQFIIFIIFSLEHVAGGMTWFQAFLGAGTGAILFGLAALKAQNISLSIGLHTAWNFGQWFLGFKNEEGIGHSIIDHGYENYIERNAWISYLIIMIIAIAAFYFYKPKHALN